MPNPTPALTLGPAPILGDVFRPRHLFAAPSGELEWQTAYEETIPWEIFRGRLLEPAQTRQEKTFTSWSVFTRDAGERSGQPVLSIKWDRDTQQLYVVRGLLCYVWEGYQAEGNVYLSREVVRWVRELVGTVELTRFSDVAALREELAGRLFRAVIGLSRLPLTSPESPLPGFSLGQFGYFYRYAPAESADRAMCTPEDLLRHGLTAERSALEQAKLVELALRAARADAIPALAGVFADRWRDLDKAPSAMGGLLRTMLNEVALSPWTDFVPNLLAFLQALVAQDHLPLVEQINFLGYTLRQLGRHLTAYDLTLFHHRGANYPDALLLDLVLKEYLSLITAQPQLFLDGSSDAPAALNSKRLRRRALRQGWLLRRQMDGLPVPDAPTSPGENMRVLPPPHVRVPNEQILQPARRRRCLFADDPLEPLLTPQVRNVLTACLADLRQPEELRELGMAVFIDRPLSRGKAPGAPDESLLFSHEAFSRIVAQRRLAEMERLAPHASAPWPQFRGALETLRVAGLPAQLCRADTSGVVSLADANRLADDFLLLRTMPSVVREFLARYAPAELLELIRLGVVRADQMLIVPEPKPTEPERVNVQIYDGAAQLRLSVEIERAV